MGLAATLTAGQESHSQLTAVLLTSRYATDYVVYLFSYSRDLPDGSISKLHLDAFCLHQRLLLLQHVVFWFSQDSVKVVSPARSTDTHLC